jgi:hypothetical protein
MLALMFSWLSAMLLDSVSPVVSYSVEMRTQYRPQGCMYGWKWLFQLQEYVVVSLVAL